MNKKWTATIGTLLVLGLVGCGNSTNQNTSQNTTNDSMKNMPMDNQSTTTSQQPLKQAFQDELNGFNTIEKDITNNNWRDATTLADHLHNEFHAAILPLLKDKKGPDYAENIHAKYDDLQDAIKDKDNQKIKDLIQVNKDNLYTVANILGISLPK